ADNYSFKTSSLDSIAHGTAYTWGLSGTTLNSLESAINSGSDITSATLTISDISDWTTEQADVLYVNLLNGVNSGVNSYEYNSNPTTNDTRFGSDYFNKASSHLKYGAAANNSLLVYNGAYNAKGYTGSNEKSSGISGATKLSNGDYVEPGTWSDPFGQGTAKNSTTTGENAGTGATDSITYNSDFNLVITLNAANISLLTGYLAADYGSSSAYVGLGFSPDCHYYDNGVCLNITTSTPTSGVPDGGMTLAMLGIALAGLAYVRSRSKAAAFC
ncbi:MAG: VPDSG-CTERM sorting domain-containing protein, partial [Terracidiphilus sp.]